MNQPRRYDHPLPLEIAMRDPQRHWPTVRTARTLGDAIRATTAALQKLGEVFQRIGRV